MLTIDPVVKINLSVGMATSESAAFDVGLILGSSDVISTTERVKQFSSLADVQAGGFAATTKEYQAAANYFASGPAPVSLLIGRIGEGETPVQALTACINANTNFDGIYVCEITTQQIADVVTYLDSIGHYRLYAGLAVAASAAVESDGILNTMKGRGTRRFAGIVNDDVLAGASLMGDMAGMFHANTDGAVQACYSSLANVSTSNLTESDVTAIKGVNSNVYISRRNSRGLLEPGTTSSGIRIDDAIYLDMIAAQIQDACFALTINQNTRLPQNDSTSAQYINAISGIMEDFVNRQVIASGIWSGESMGELETGDTLERGYYLHAESYTRQSAADREAHRAVPIACCMILAGSVESVEIYAYAQR